MINKEPTISVTLSEYNRLVKQDIWVDCLERAGVDNWDGYGFAIKYYREYCVGLDNE